MDLKKRTCISFYKITHGQEKFNQGLRQIREELEGVPSFSKLEWEGALAELEYSGDSLSNKAFTAIREILSPVGEKND